MVQVPAPLKLTTWPATVQGPTVLNTTALPDAPPVAATV